MSEEGGGQDESVELSLRLDQDGRTTYDPAVVATPSSATSSSLHSSVDYSSKTVLTKLADVSGAKASDLLDDLLFDAEIADCALLPRTFWMPAEGMKPRCRLEQMAMEVFHKHVPVEGYTYDKSTSGAEWWVQIRPSPAAGRYSMLADASSSSTSGENDNTCSNGKDDDMSTSGISFHWDKDEDLRLAMGGNLYIHPHLSTVMYLTDLGAPTAALNYRVDPTTGAYIEPNSQGENSTAYISWPKQGKHLSFDGRLLHAAPGDLLKGGEFAEQCKCDFTGISDEKEKHVVQRRHRRVTFLVNIWLNFKPINVQLFPEGMIDKLSSSKDDEQSILFEANASHSKEKDKANDHCKSKSITVPTKGFECDVFSWPMGGCGSNERINVAVPLAAIQEEKDTSGNIRIEWTNENGVAIERKDGGVDRGSGGSEREGDTERVGEEEPEAKKQKTENSEKD